MSFSLTEHKQISKWVDFENGETKARIKVRGIKYKPFAIANERIQNNFNVSGLKIDDIGSDEMSFQDMLFKITGEYLIEDWENIAIQKDGEILDIAYSKDSAFQIMSLGGASGLVLWDFVMQSARKIQTEADGYKDEIMGKSETSTNGANSTEKTTKVRKSTTKK